MVFLHETRGHNGTHSAVGSPDKTVQTLAERLRRGEGGHQVRTAYAYALSAAGANGDALISAKETALLYPGEVSVHICLGEMFRRAEQLPEAITELQIAMDCDPGNEEAEYLTGCAWLDAGEPQSALTHFAGLSLTRPGLMQKTAAAEAMLARPRADPAYVRHLFNKFSADYDVHMLSRLHYCAPKILRALYDSLPERRTGLIILDLGCGTGLCGEAFQDVTKQIIGVDLSPAMIEKARVRAIYDGFDVADIESPPKAQNAFDLVTAADALVYIGDLGKVFTTARTALKSGGHFLFSVEKKGGAGFDLGPKRRWRHSDRYLQDCARVAGFALIRLSPCTLREERGTPVPGFAVALQKL